MSNLEALRDKLEQELSACQDSLGALCDRLKAPMSGADCAVLATDMMHTLSDTFATGYMLRLVRGGIEAEDFVAQMMTATCQLMTQPLGQPESMLHPVFKANVANTWLNTAMAMAGEESVVEVQPSAPGTPPVVAVRAIGGAA